MSIKHFLYQLKVEFSDEEASLAEELSYSQLLQASFLINISNHKKLEKIMAEIDDILAEQGQLKTALADLGTSVTNGFTATQAEFKALNDKIAALQQQGAGSVTQAQLDELKADSDASLKTVTDLASQVNAGFASLQPAQPATT